MASLATLIKQRLNLEAISTPGKTGQFDVLADGERIAARSGNWFTRKFGAGYPDFDQVVKRLAEKQRASHA